MNPETAMKALKTTGELTAQYGIQVVLCFTVMIFFGFVIWWVLNFMRDLVNGQLSRVTIALQSLTESNNSAHANHLLAFERISKDMKDGFDAMNRGNAYQREEHKDLKAAEMDTRTEVLKELRRLEDGLECKAK